MHGDGIRRSKRGCSGRGCFPPGAALGPPLCYGASCSRARRHSASVVPTRAMPSIMLSVCRNRPSIIACACAMIASRRPWSDSRTSSLAVQNVACSIIEAWKLESGRTPADCAIAASRQFAANSAGEGSTFVGATTEPGTFWAYASIGAWVRASAIKRRTGKTYLKAMVAPSELPLRSVAEYWSGASGNFGPVDRAITAVPRSRT